MLLVMDNCEHVIAGCAELAHDILQTCLSVTLLATSREPLRLSGEVILRYTAKSKANASRWSGSSTQATSISGVSSR